MSDLFHSAISASSAINSFILQSYPSLMANCLGSSFMEGREVEGIQISTGFPFGFKLG